MRSNNNTNIIKDVDDLENLTIERYYDFLKSKSINFEDLDENILKKHYIRVYDDEQQLGSTNLYNCLVLDIKLENEKRYYLYESHWYEVEENYEKKLQKTFEDRCKDEEKYAEKFGNYNGSFDGEGVYNQHVAKELSFICLDCTDIAKGIKGHSKLEPCDLYTVEDEKPVFFHVKKDYGAAAFSHFFNQGLNSFALLKNEEKANDQLKDLIKNKSDIDKHVNAIDNIYLSKIVYVIISKKEAPDLPLFSLISFHRMVYSLDLKVEVRCVFVFDERKKSKNAKK